ncbi:succinate dehydrogenase, cytochrome b556 subunit [Candidatus Odyssella thessalonicensis]|uniref:succinate dehydrogenase, cytochrome b556 subunit n=1 Tax=Candidatus Odyssella thessalonicensis TaxID=84647 RepID=UPI000495E671|nr:succinate dehydrogenase, cytochrome b556 subunit [Candidatus Odyssella thessalonicensis]
MKPRPLSPHLQIYRPQITSVLSILHRITGIGLVISLLFFIAWIISLAMDEASYLCFKQFMGSWIGQTVLFFSLFGFYYHLANGIRHLAWDIGQGYELHIVRITGWLVILTSIIATLLTWRLA